MYKVYFDANEVSIASYNLYSKGATDAFTLAGNTVCKLFAPEIKPTNESMGDALAVNKENCIDIVRSVINGKLSIMDYGVATIVKPAAIKFFPNADTGELFILFISGTDLVYGAPIAPEAALMAAEFIGVDLHV